MPHIAVLCFKRLPGAFSFDGKRVKWLWIRGLPEVPRNFNGIHMNLIIRWFSVALGFMAAAHFVPGITLEGGFSTAILLAALWGIVGVLVKPILLILTLPVTILTLGLFVFVINAGLFWWLGRILADFHVAGFQAALFGSVLLSVVSSVTHWVLEKFRDDD